MRIQYAQPEPLIMAVADRLKTIEQIQPPVWASFVKTGVHKERPPAQEDWWFIRSAAILRKVAMQGPIGTSKLRVHFGGRKNRGHKPDAFRRGSGSVIRNALQQLEAAGLVKQVETHGHKGRVVTPQGESLLDSCVIEVNKQ